MIVSLILQQRRNVLGAASVSKIKSEDIILSFSSELKYFYEPAPNSIIKDDENEPDYGEYSINADSINALRDYAISKEKDVFRIIAIGDSFTYGLHVNTDSNWVSLLERKLNQGNCTDEKKYEVINLGAMGYDAAYEVERFKTRGAKYKPDLVIWLVVDPYRVSDQIIPLMREYAKQGLPAKYSNVDGKMNTRWGRAMNHLITTYGYDQLLQYNEKTITTLNKYYNGNVLLAVVPEIVDAKGKQMVKGIASKFGWDYFDKFTNFFKLSGYTTGDNHPNAKGHQLIAKELFGELQKSNLVHCK